MKTGFFTKFLIICPKGKFLWKLFYNNLANLLWTVMIKFSPLPTYWAPSSYNISNKSLDLIIRYKAVQLWLKLGPNCLFSPRDIFWENWLLLSPTYLVLSYCNISKNSQRANHQTRLHNFGPNWVRLDFSTKKEFHEKVNQDYFGLLCVFFLSFT